MDLLMQKASKSTENLEKEILDNFAIFNFHQCNGITELKIATNLLKTNSTQLTPTFLKNFYEKVDKIHNTYCRHPLPRTTSSFQYGNASQEHIAYQTFNELYEEIYKIVNKDKQNHTLIYNETINEVGEHTCLSSDTSEEASPKQKKCSIM